MTDTAKYKHVEFYISYCTIVHGLLHMCYYRNFRSHQFSLPYCMLQMAVRLRCRLSIVVWLCINRTMCTASNVCSWKYDSVYKEAILKNVSCTALSSIDKDMMSIVVKHTRVKAVNDYQFAGAPSLRNVYIYYNGISSIAATAFFGSCCIQNLWLNNNRIKYLPRGLFECQTNLGQLHLDFNNIKHIDGSMFRSLPLSTLWIDHNELNIIPRPEAFCALLRGLRIVRIFNDLSWETPHEVGQLGGNSLHLATE